MDTNAYKPQDSLSERVWLSMDMVVIQPYILASKQKKTKPKFLRCTGYVNSIKPYKAIFIANSSSCKTT